LLPADAELRDWLFEDLSRKAINNKIDMAHLTLAKAYGFIYALLHTTLQSLEEIDFIGSSGELQSPVLLSCPIHFWLFDQTAEEMNRLVTVEHV